MGNGIPDEKRAPPSRYIAPVAFVVEIQHRDTAQVVLEVVLARKCNVSENHPSGGPSGCFQNTHLKRPAKVLVAANGHQNAGSRSVNLGDGWLARNPVIFIRLAARRHRSDRQRPILPSDESLSWIRTVKGVFYQARVIWNLKSKVSEKW